MRRDFVETVSQMMQIRRRDLIEKDLILHQLLLDLSHDELFSSSFLFKVGTCLKKHHLGKFRFSLVSRRGCLERWFGGVGMSVFSRLNFPCFPLFGR